MPQFKKGDRVRAKATLFDGGEGTRDRNGLLFSEKWAADGHGEWCYGAVSFVYSRRGRHTQLYRVKYDEGTVMQAEDAHLELAEDEDDSDEDQTVQCHMVRLGNKRTVEGTHRGEIRAVQMRCTSCSKRNRQNEVRGRAPLTAWCCSVHSEVYACKHKTCWEEHLAEVRQVREREDML